VNVDVPPLSASPPAHEHRCPAEADLLGQQAWRAVRRDRHVAGPDASRRGRVGQRLVSAQHDQADADRFAAHSEMFANRIRS